MHTFVLDQGGRRHLVKLLQVEPTQELFRFRLMQRGEQLARRQGLVGCNRPDVTCHVFQAGADRPFFSFDIISPTAA